MYYIDVRHDGLGKFRRVTGSDRYVAEERARAQRQLWDDQWSRRCAIDAAREKRQNRASTREAKKKEAADQTLEAQSAITALKTTLASTLTAN